MQRGECPAEWAGLGRGRGIFSRATIREPDGQGMRSLGLHWSPLKSPKPARSLLPYVA